MLESIFSNEFTLYCTYILRDVNIHYMDVVLICILKYSWDKFSIFVILIHL